MENKVRRHDLARGGFYSLTDAGYERAKAIVNDLIARA
jgi:hypothetical protein